MPRFLVIAREVLYRSVTIDADDAEDARFKAEEQDWRNWTADDSTYIGETEIVEVQEV